MQEERQWLENFEINQRVTNTISYVLVALMLSSLVGAFVKLVEQVVVWRGGYLPWISFVIVLEAIYTKNMLRDRMINAFEREWFLYRLTEWLTIAVLLRILAYFLAGFDVFLADLATWPANFFGSFFSLEFNVMLATVLIVWNTASAYADDLRVLQSSERDLGWERLSEMELDRQTARHRMMSRTFILGSLLIAIVAITRWGQRIATNPVQITSPILNLIVYFGLAFIFLSLTHFSVLRARWLWQQIPITPQVARMWFWYGTIFFLLLLAISVILPRQYALSLLDTLRYGLSLIAHAFQFIFDIIVIVLNFFIVLLGLILSLFSFKTLETIPTNPDTEAVTPPAPPIASAPMPWLELLKSILFWGIFLAIVIYGIDYYLRQNIEILEALKRFRLIAWISQGLNWLKERFQNFNHQLAEAAKSGVERLRSSRLSAGRKRRYRFVNLRRLSPREKVIFLFLTMVRRGEEKGLPRRNAQTPQQYADKLQSALPDVETDLDTMAASFVEARYSLHPISEEQAGLVRRAWNYVRRALLGRQKDIPDS